MPEKAAGSGYTLEVPVDSDSVLIDLDTPEDYARLRSVRLRSEAD